jgi:hypothetical protein
VPSRGLVPLTDLGCPRYPGRVMGITGRSGPADEYSATQIAVSLRGGPLAHRYDVPRGRAVERGLGAKTSGNIQNAQTGLA